MRRVCAALIALGLFPAADAPRTQDASFRLLSWNVSGMRPVEQADTFHGHLALSSPDILLLDEVEGGMSEQAFQAVLDASGRTGWRVLWGRRGGRQRIVMAARSALTGVGSFQTNAYDPAEIDAVSNAAPPAARDTIRRDMANGIPVNAATITVNGRRLLLAGVDLQCCSDGWQETRRLGEARQIRRLLDAAIRAQRPDGVIVAGDFNLSAPPGAHSGIGALPLVVLSGPYAAPVDGLIAAEAMQRDGHEAWTINGGADSPFPYMPFDFQLYSPHSLRVTDAQVLDTADYPSDELRSKGLVPASSGTFSDHRAVVVTYEWSARR